MEKRKHYWNGRWGRLARHDVLLYEDGGQWTVEHRIGGVEGRCAVAEFDAGGRRARPRPRPPRRRATPGEELHLSSRPARAKRAPELRVAAAEAEEDGEHPDDGHDRSDDGPGRVAGHRAAAEDVSPCSVQTSPARTASTPMTTHRYRMVPSFAACRITPAAWRRRRAGARQPDAFAGAVEQVDLVEVEGQVERIAGPGRRAGVHAHGEVHGGPGRGAGRAS